MFTDEADVEDLRLAQEVALAVAGAVYFPSPAPALGLLLLGTLSPTAVARRQLVEDEYYLRIVEFVSPNLIVSRYVYAGTRDTVGDVRLIKGLVVENPEKNPAIFTDKPRILVGAELASYLGKLKDVKKKEYDVKGEQVAAKDAVAYVPEQATVQLRADLETIAGKCELPLTPCNPVNNPTCGCEGNGGWGDWRGRGGHLLPW